PAFVPTTLKQEKSINPFLRCHENSIRQAVGLDDPADVFAELRRRKDRF
ncbi:MAG TPA: hydroxyacylglutathione hydrolase, partial [Phycisphaerales bacterium]|nr:hydroxyacylglutathione hydrolase [Phycisphaerales bacterium]